MRKKITYQIRCGIFLLLSISVACNKTTYDIPYAGDKIVVNGFIDNEQGCVVAISKTGPASGNFDYDRNEVKEAHVFLFENGVQIAELTRDNTKNFVLKKLSPKIGAKYVLKVTASGLPDAESEEVLYEAIPQISNVRTEVKEGLVFNRKGVLFTFKLDFDTTKTNYFLVKTYGDADQVGGFFFNLTNINYSCDVFSFYYDLLFSTKCLTSGTDIKQGIDVYNPKTSGQSSSVTLKISSIPKAYFEYQQYSDQLYKSINAALLEPDYHLPNIKNGYGNFYTKNYKMLTVKL